VRTYLKLTIISIISEYLEAGLTASISIHHMIHIYFYKHEFQEKKTLLP